MSLPDPARRPAPTADVVARLRAAGCVFAEDEARLLTAAAATTAELDVLVGRRAAGAPLEYVLGWAEFCGLRILLEPGVFVPRRRSEFLVATAAALGRARVERVARVDRVDRVDRVVAGRPGGARPVVVVDLCCGSGALGAALAAELGRVELHAADLDPVAVRCARRNLAATGAAVYQGDLDDPLPGALRGRVDLLVANVPYVPSAEVSLLPAEARCYEPLAALDGGPDGLGVLRRVSASAPLWLAPGGHLLVETSERQAEAATATFRSAGLAAWVVRDEDVGATVIVAAAAQPPVSSGTVAT